MKSQLLLFLTLLASRSSGLEVKCRDYNFCCYHRVGQIYQCELINIDTFADMSSHDTVTEVTHVRIYGDSLYDFRIVQGFVAHQGKMSFFPRGLEKFLEELTTIRITEVGLEEVHQQDLEPFTKLVHLCLSDNSLTAIERDLFKFNANLEVVNLSYNPIKHIDPHVFSGLGKLEYVNLIRVTCKLERTDEVGSANVRKLVENIENRECFDAALADDNLV
jgi:Leucine-rich repeat (LRR) protein